MAQGKSGEDRRSVRWGTVAVIAAIIALGFAIGYKLRQNAGEAAPASVASGQAAPGDPLASFEAKARDNPQDAAAQAALAEAYYDSGRFDDAVKAYDRAIAIDGGKGLYWSARGEARIMASAHDPMPSAAAADFEKAVALDAKDPRARYFLAVRRDLRGDHKGAIDDWLALLADTPPGAPWESDLRRTITQVAKINKIDLGSLLPAAAPVAPPMAAQAIPGPSQADLANARNIAPGEQRQMAEGMVERLEGKLKTNPANVEGWVMLMRSRMTLEQPDKAAQALKDALAANPDNAALLNEQAGVLGVK